MMTKVLFTGIGFVLGVGVATFAGWSMQEKVMPTENVSTGHTTMDHQSMDASMSDMTARLVGKTGNEFDAIFLEDMIVHHQGAIDMANAALIQAGHEELKSMAKEIIAAQSGEISQMKKWQEEWFK